MSEGLSKPEPTDLDALMPSTSAVPDGVLKLVEDLDASWGRKFEALSRECADQKSAA